jgi:hypothetical protein
MYQGERWLVRFTSKGMPPLPSACANAASF